MIFKTKLFCALVLLFLPAFGADYYVGQSATGNGSGSNAQNSHSAAWAGSAKFNPGDVIHLVGSVTSLSISSNGTATNPITLYFEPNARLSSPASDLLNITNRSGLVIDGGQNGVIENTDNGTALKNHVATKGINASGISNVTIKNLTIRNLYVHTSPADSSIDFTTGGGIYANGYGPGIIVQNCSFSDICWCMTMFGSAGGSLSVDRCSFLNYDHGIGGVAAFSGALSGFSVTNSHFGSTANWDTTANTYHHDGIHTFWGNGSSGIPKAVISGNTFDGDWGINNTAHLFFEQNYNTHNPAEAAGWIISNNVHNQNPKNYLNNGFMVMIGDAATITGNTYNGSSVALSQGVSISGKGATFTKNTLSGLNRFVDASLPFNVANFNTYASPVPSGNTPFRYQGASVNTFQDWQKATGQEANSSFGVVAPIPPPVIVPPIAIPPTAAKITGSISTVSADGKTITTVITFDKSILP